MSFEFFNVYNLSARNILDAVIQAMLKFEFILLNLFCSCSLAYLLFKPVLETVIISDQS